MDDVPPDELVAQVTGSLLAGIAHARTALDAELVLCDMFGTVETRLADDVDDDGRLAALTLLMSQLMTHAEGLGTPDALALLRVCSVLGPPATQVAAGEAAGRLAAAGVKDRPWADRVGSPEMVSAWRYGDVFGAQSSIGVLFADRGRDHALMVLIDHDLGGGVKDCCVAVGKDATRMRATVASAMAGQPTAFFERLDAASAAGWLREALASPPCPEAEDQVADVAANLYLTSSRTQRLARLAGLPPAEPLAAAESGAADSGVLRIKVTLKGIRPPVWRRLEVPASISLARLHSVLQTAFGWTDSHLHCFEVPMPGRRPRVIDGAASRRTRLHTVAGGVGDTLVYRYDFGDDWTHAITVEARQDAEAGAEYPTCTGGRRAAPPEDCGGAPGYTWLLESLAAGVMDDEGMIRAGFDPAAFDRAAVDAALRHLR